MFSVLKKKLLKSTPEYKNHKKRFQAGYFPSKSRKKKSKKSKILDSIEGSGSVTAECKVIGDLYQSQTISLDVSNISGISSNSTMKWILNGVTKDIDCDATHCWNNSMNAPSVPGNYDYVLTYNEKTVCAGIVGIGSALTCAVSPNELNKGEEYSFTAHRNITCWNCYYQFDNGTENNIQFGDGIYDISLTKTATVLGNKTLSLNCTCNGNIAASCSQEITINDVPPSFSCPDDLSFETNSQITITPKDLTGCESGCAYTISGTSVSTTNFEYSSGALPSFTAPSTAGTVPYTISLTNNVGTTPKDCSVEIIEPKPCVASDWIIEQNNSNKEILGPFNDGCFEINTEKMCSNAQIHVSSGSGEIILNGKTFSCGYHDEGITPQSIIELKVPKTCTVSKLYVSNCVDPPKAPAFSCPANLSFEVNSSVTITPTGVTGCESGCDYEISGTSVQGNSYTGGALPSFTAPSTAGTSNYTITLTNSTGSTSHNCSVEFTESGSGGSEFACNESNSTNVAKEADYSASANGCIKYVMDGASNLQIGCWWAPSTPVSVKVQTCNGSVTTISHSCGGWVAVPVGGTCSIFLEPQGQMNLKFNNW